MKKNNSFKRNKGNLIKKHSSLNNNGFRIKGENKPKGKPLEIMGNMKL